MPRFSTAAAAAAAAAVALAAGIAQAQSGPYTVSDSTTTRIYTVTQGELQLHCALVTQAVYFERFRLTVFARSPSLGLWLRSTQTLALSDLQLCIASQQ